MKKVIAKNVTENLYVRHIAPVFLGTTQDSGQAAQSESMPMRAVMEKA